MRKSRCTCARMAYTKALRAVCFKYDQDVSFAPYQFQECLVASEASPIYLIHHYVFDFISFDESVDFCEGLKFNHGCLDLVEDVLSEYLYALVPLAGANFRIN